MNDSKTKGVNVITGDPHKAIRNQSIPLILSMLLMMAYNVVDSIWVAGLGTVPLAALGFISPLFMINIGIGNGMGAGVTSLIARSIGADDKVQAENAGLHGLLIGVIISIVIPVIILIIIKPLLVLMGAHEVFNQAYQYAWIVFIGSFSFYFPAIGSAILRGEGDVNRATVAMAVTAVLNIVLDPIFIYILNLGIAGAAYATVISSFISLLVIFYWILVKKNTYLQLNLKDFKFNPQIVKDIILVGLPGSVEQIITQSVGLFNVSVLAMVAGTTAVAVFTAGWRIVTIVLVPNIGIATAALTVAGVAFGSHNFENLKDTYYYSSKLALLISVILAVLIFVFAPQISIIFSYTSASAQLLTPIAEFLRVECFLFILTPIGICAAYMFQGVGKGIMSLYLTIVRQLILTVFFVCLLTFVLGFGEQGVWWGMVLGTFFGSLVNYGVFIVYLKRLAKAWKIV